MDPIFVLVLIFAIFVPVGIILSLVVFPAMRKRRSASTGDAPSAADDLRDEPPLDDR
jgi:hypothetical protein